MSIAGTKDNIIFEPKALYYFSSEHLNTDDPHYFIVVKINGQVMHLVVCTKQFEKRKNYIERRGLDHSTLVWIKPCADNKLTLDSYVDCNTVFSDYTSDVLNEKYKDGLLKFKGFITDSEYYQIMYGITKSEDVDLGVIRIIQAALDEF